MDIYIFSLPILQINLHPDKYFENSRAVWSLFFQDMVANFRQRVVSSSWESSAVEVNAFYHFTRNYISKYCVKSFSPFQSLLFTLVLPGGEKTLLGQITDITYTRCLLHTHSHTTVDRSPVAVRYGELNNRIEIW